MPPLTAFDKLVSLEPGSSASAIRNVPNTLAIFDSHFPHFPVLPGVLALGTLEALAAALLRDADGRSWRLAQAQQVGFRHFIQPGDQMALTVRITERSDAEAVLSGEVKVDDRIVIRARKLRMIPR